MMKKFIINSILIIIISMGLLDIQGCKESDLNIEVFETSESGHKLTKVNTFEPNDSISVIEIKPEVKLQEIIGFGGAFTDASAFNLYQLSPAKREEILKAYFSENGAAYSLNRTHMNSCDFSRFQYSYAPTENDTNLNHFSIQADSEFLIPMIKEAKKYSKNGFKLFGSPWTAPPWMKDNKSWVGGKLLPEYYETWANFFSKYIEAYKKQGIDIWGLTVENEPMGNGNNWESMHFTPEEMTHFVKDYLGPILENDGRDDIVILGYDQNRADLINWVDVMYADEENSKYFDGTAVHWYESTYDYFPKELQYAHSKAPNKLLLQTEACIDSEVPVWKDDKWYWKKEATDWGFDWRPEELKYLHPKYAPVTRYARDIIGCLNNWVQGWVDWNMILDKQGGPNWFKNWCIAPVIVDPKTDEVYYTPLYYVMAHFSKFIRPGSHIIKSAHTDADLMVVAAENKDGSLVVVVFNEGIESKSFKLKSANVNKIITIGPQSIQTIRTTN